MYHIANKGNVAGVAPFGDVCAETCRPCDCTLFLPQMARLLAGSKGETALTEETWKAVMAMEHQREERVRVV